jgi:hypothetical protein
VCGCCRNSRWTARTLADALAAGDPPVMVRDYQTDLGHIDLDPCNLHPGEAEKVAQAACHSPAPEQLIDVALHACPPPVFVLKYFWICNYWPLPLR